MQQSPELANAFRWKTGTLPAKYKRDSVSYYQALEVALIGGLMFGTAVFFLQQAFFPASILTGVLCISSGVIAVLVQMTIYKRLLR